MASTLSTLLRERHELSTADIPTLGYVLLGSSGFWSLVYFLSHLYMYNVKKDCKAFHQLTDGDKALYLSRIPAALHAFLAFILASIVIFSTW